MESEIIAPEILEIILSHCDTLDVPLKLIETAFSYAENQGYVQDGWTNSPDLLLGYIKGFIAGVLNKKYVECDHKWLNTTKNYIRVKKCYNCGKINPINKK